MNKNDREMADRIGVTVRRVQQLAADGVLWRHDTGAFDIADNARAYRVYSDNDVDEVCRQIEAEARSVEDDLDALREARTPEQRWKLAQEVGPHVGRLNKALRLSIAMDSPGSRQLLTSWTDMVMGRVVGDFLALANLEIRDDPA